jgi:hypothetical protein
MTLLERVRLRMSTAGQLLQLFWRSGRFFLVPLVVILLVGSALLVLSELFGALAPFVYAVF